MAKRGRKQRRRSHRRVAGRTASRREAPAGSLATANDLPQSDEQADALDSSAPAADDPAAADPTASAVKVKPKPALPAGGGLPIYKPGQGYYTRMGTVVGFGTLLLGGLAWLHDKLAVFSDEKWGVYARNGPIVLLFFGFAALLYWLTGRNRRTCDFMIATEGEMKKVSWSSKKEIIGSTKVVLGAVVLVALILFLVDMGFRELFTALNVLRIGEAPTGR